ncbi:MAG: 6,7-dimethyl-8-ribityllumazine synthase [Flavobacteriales bacterium]
MQNQKRAAYSCADLPDAKGMRFGLVVAGWHSEITERLVRGVTETLKKNGATPGDIIGWNVPGSFELIYGIARMLQQHRLKLDAIIAIGCLIRGETHHFDFISQGVTQGIKDLNVRAQIPVIFCVLTDDTWQQSRDRSGGKLSNKGVESAVAAIKMAALRRRSNA